MAQYVATSLIAHPRFSCHEGKALIGCPPDLLRQFITDKIVKLSGEGGPPEQLIADQDVLTPLSQKQLVSIIMRTTLPDGTKLRTEVKPMSDWSDEQIRQAIRDVVLDLDLLTMPDGVANAPSTNSGETVGQP